MKQVTRQNKPQKLPLFWRYMILVFSSIIFTSILGTLLTVLLGMLFPSLPTQSEFVFMGERFVVHGVLTFLTVGSVISIFATRQVLKPINAVSKTVQQVTAGDFSVRLSNRRQYGNEITELIENLNAMIAELSRNEYLHKDFVSNVSHEFKTPLCAIQGYTELLANDELSREQQQEYIAIIQKQTARLSKLSANLLRLSELENQTMLSQKATFSLDEQIRDAVILLQNEWEEKDIELDLNLDEIRYTADRELLYQVWVNMIGNAIKYTPAGGLVGVRLRYLLNAGSDAVQGDSPTQQGRIEVEISDTGIGMTPEEAARAFDRFYKADRARSSTSNGLGLSICKKIVALHGGEIRVISNVENGSQFFITLP